MQHTPLPSEALPVGARPAAPAPFIYVACPWSPAGGGMYKVADYLIQSQAAQPPAGAAQLRPLDTRGPGSALASFGFLLRALGRIARGRASGQLAGVHVNLAERLSLVRKGAVVAACRALGVPVVIHLHAQMRPFYLALPAPLRAATRWVFRMADGVAVIGEAPRRFVADELGVAPGRIEVILNGVPGPAAPPVRACDPAVRRILFVGRLCDPKGVSDLLQAFAEAGFAPGQVRLVLAGNGDIEGYRRRAEALGIAAAVEFTGWCDQAQVHAQLRQADLLVLPSHDEVLPLVVLEALSQAVPVLCTPVGELPEVLIDGHTACFVPARDVPRLAAALSALVADDARRQALGRNGRALYEAHFSLPRFFSSVARLHARHFGVSAAAEPARAEARP